MMRMAAIALISLATMTSESGQETMSKELTSLQGTWIITAFNGEDHPAGAPEVTLSFTNDKYAQSFDGNVVERGTVKIDASKKPMWMDLQIVEGDDANKLQLGIAQIADGKMTFKLATPGATTRPTDFAVADGFLVFSMTKKPKG